MDNQTSIVRSDHGKLNISRIDGVVISVEPKEPANYLSTIDRFDLREWVRFHQDRAFPDELDIVDLGFWDQSGVYEPAVAEWRLRSLGSAASVIAYCRKQTDPSHTLSLAIEAFSVVGDESIVSELRLALVAA